MQKLGAQGIAELVDEELKRILGISERWRLMKADPEKRLIDHISAKPYLVADVPIIHTTADVQVLVSLPSHTTVAIIVDENGEAVGTISPNEVWQIRKSRWYK